MTFEALIGNEALVSRLARMAEADAVPPSMLFTGPAGVGKLDAAIALAQSQNCLTTPGKPCGTCAACVRIERGEHPDVRIARPEGAGRQLKADSVRAIVNETPFRPFEGRRRVSIFADADRMNPTAANTILKTLEEPPPWAILILVTSNAAALLPTILSRCQVYRFAPLPIDDVIERLVTVHEMKRDDAAILAALSGGSVQKAIELKDESLEDLRDEALRVAGLVATGATERDIVAWADRLSKDDNLFLVLQLVLGILRDVAATVGGGTVAHRNLAPKLGELASGASLSRWLEAYRLAESSLEDLRDRYLNKRITMNHLLTTLARR